MEMSWTFFFFLFKRGKGKKRKKNYFFRTLVEAKYFRFSFLIFDLDFLDFLIYLIDFFFWFFRKEGRVFILSLKWLRGRKNERMGNDKKGILFLSLIATILFPYWHPIISASNWISEPAIAIENRIEGINSVLSDEIFP